jgi:predicted regulator of Ras-like GTPase activity (Roadblock/LC7/MglB family)
MSKSQKHLSETLTKMAEEINGLLAAAYVDISTGMPLASYKKSTLDPDVAAAFNAEVVKSKLKAIQALNMQESITDILITLQTQIHLLVLSPDATAFIYVAAEEGKTSLGVVRSVCKKYLKEMI